MQVTNWLKFATHPQDENAIELPRDSAIAVYAEDQAGCGGRIYLNIMTGELWLCDGSDLILWSGGAMHKLMEQ